MTANNFTDWSARANAGASLAVFPSTDATMCTPLTRLVTDASPSREELVESTRAGNEARGVGASVTLCGAGSCGCGALCADEHATSMTKNFFTHSVTRELRNRFLFFDREPEFEVVPTMFMVQSGFGGTEGDYVEFG
jgi:hypothetical protein